MSRKTQIFVVDAGDLEAVETFRTKVNALLVIHPNAHLTWLQSGSTDVAFKKVGELEQGRGRPQFLLTCVAEFYAVGETTLTPETVAEDVGKALEPTPSPFTGGLDDARKPRDPRLEPRNPPAGKTTKPKGRA